MDSPLIIAHRPTCPVAHPDFKLPTNPDGTVDTDAPQRCDCDLMQRLEKWYSERAPGA